MFKSNISNKSMIEKAAARVMMTALEESRALKAYRHYLKETKSPKQLEGDDYFDKLRSEMELTKANHYNAKRTLEVVNQVPPIQH